MWQKLLCAIGLHKWSARGGGYVKVADDVSIGLKNDRVCLACGQIEGRPEKVLRKEIASIQSKQPTKQK
jgi:hypothetical protein